MQIASVTTGLDIEKQLDRVVPFFQPIMDLQQQSVWSYECLARLLTEDEQLLMPSAFLRLVERRQCHGQLTKLILHRSAHYFRDKAMPWSINISRQDILDPSLTPFLRAMLESHPNAQRIILELTAGTALNHLDDFKAFLLVCKDLGIRLFIDHFGEVNYNIKKVLHLPIDGIKVSGGLISQLSQNAEVNDFVHHLAAEAQANDVLVIAEHIEDKATLNSVAKLGIQYGQGFYFSQPSKVLPN